MKKTPFGHCSGYRSFFSSDTEYTPFHALTVEPTRFLDLGKLQLARESVVGK